MELNSVFKISARLLCFLGLFFHSCQLFYEYWQGKTIVNIEIDRKENVSLPGITICYPYLFSFEKVSHLDNFYNEQYLIYQSIINSTHNETDVQAQLRMIYQRVVDNLLDQINNKTFDLENMIENYTLVFKDNLIKILIDSYVHEEDDSGYSNCDDHPIESYAILPSDGIIWADKCFTFFSALNKTWRNYRKNPRNFFLRIDNNIKLFPHDPFGIFFLSVHSSNSLPNNLDGNYHLIQLGQIFNIRYSRMYTNLLGHNFDTNCFEYNLDYNYSNFNMRSDCITWCYH